jgi:glycosyltransferase involved in cell wall biosynthesis
MKILFLTRLYLPHVGGVEKHIFEISKTLSKNYQITIITEQHDPKLPLYEKSDLAEIYRIPLGGASESMKKWFIWSWLFSHIDLIHNTDILHIHDVFFWFLPFRPIFPLKKVFMTFHGYEGINAPGKKQILSHRIAEKLTSGNICIGDFHRKWYHTKPTIVSYGAVHNLPVSS